MAYELQSDGRYHIPIVDLGERLRDNFGLTIREHEHFDPVDDVHAPNSYHYHGEAIDVQDWRDDVIAGVDWRTRTGNLQNLLAGSGAEIIGPNSGDPNHSTHLHLAADGGIFKLNQEQYDHLFGGGAGGLKATFASYTPPETPQSPAGGQVDSPTGPRVTAKERAQNFKSISDAPSTNYKEMSKAQLDAAYDAMRSDSEKARVEGMKMHKALFNKP